ncbi:MAG: hypothetical protein CM15mP73_4270 [Hyphomicrobiales bacterium]|nr:MAG: hypothetical protein CM15mP73_4270 [Hyphomicrobiales bacterium]
MCEKHLEYFRDKLQNWKEEIISNSKLTLENLQEKTPFLMTQIEPQMKRIDQLS